MIFLCKLIVLILVPTLLLFASFRAYEYANINQLFEEEAPSKMTYDVFDL
jgi:hypothetical protein